MSKGGNYIEIAGGKIIELAEEDYILQAGGNIISEAAKTVTEIGLEKGVSFDEYVADENDNIYDSLKENDSSTYNLPMLVGYSLGYDKTHTYPNDLNDKVKQIALSQEDRGSGINGRLPDGFENMENISEAGLKKNMQDLFHSNTSSDNGMHKVGEEMVERFLNNTGGTYENNTLNTVVSKDFNYYAFKRAAVYKLLIKLKMVDYDLSKLESNDLVRFHNVAFNDKKLLHYNNRNNGLLITVDAVEHIEMYLTDYSYNKQSGNFYMEVAFVMYDTFGLDLEDVRKYGKRIIADTEDDWEDKYIRWIFGEGFTAWWLLQYRYNHKPFTTKITCGCKGKFNADTIYRHPQDPSKNTSNDTNYNKPI